MIKIRKPYEEFKDKPELECKDVSLTKQAMKDECDVNIILKRYAITGQLPEMIKADPIYGDFSDSGTFHEAMEVVKMAEAQFAALPAETRDRFGNEPVKFLAFAEDPKNQEKLIEMGLATRKPEPEKVPKPDTSPQKTLGAEIEVPKR